MGSCRALRLLSAQQQTLLEEINHRVKNHLQAIIALTPAGQGERIDQIRLRMLVLARVYDKLRLRPQGPAVGADNFLTGLTADFEESLAPNGEVKLHSSVSCGPLGSKEAVFVGLIANEGVSNSLKYAFPHGHGTIAISLQENDGERTLLVRDDGAGDGGSVKGSGQGRRLIDRLARDLGGKVRVEGPPGYCVSVIYPSPAGSGC
jgi:two-component sensor histidine kinase